MPQIVGPNLIKLDDGRLLFLNPANGQMVQVTPQQAVQLMQQQAAQVSSLQQPKTLGESLLDSAAKGAQKAAKKKAQEELLGGSSTEGEPSKLEQVLRKLGEKAGWLEPESAGPITDSLSTVTLDSAPSFAMEAPAYEVGYTAAPEATASVVPEAGASVVSDATLTGAPAEFSLGAESAGTVAPGAEVGMFDLGGIGSAGNVILPALGAYGAYQTADYTGNAPSGGKRNNLSMAGGAASGAMMGSYFGPWGTAIGGVLGGLAGGAGSYFGSDKGERQMTRDAYRKTLLDKNSSLFDSNYQGTLADNSSFDWGKDKFGFGSGEGDFDLSKPAVGKAAAYGNTLAALQGAKGKSREAIATQFLGASTANIKDANDLGTVKANMKKFMGDLGINDRDQAQMALSDASKEGMSQQEWSVFSKDLDELFSPSYPTGFDKDGKWVGTSTPAPRATSNNGSPGRRPKK